MICDRNFKPNLKHVETPTILRNKRKNGGVSNTQLFERLVIVSLQREVDDSYSPYTSYTFPPIIDDQPDSILQTLPLFCFPDSDIINLDNNVVRSTYSFVLTDVSGEKRHGYCRRLPSVKDAKQPQVYCVLSLLACYELYSNLLDRLEELHLLSHAAIFSFLKSTIARPVPAPGHTLTAQQLDHRTGTMETITIKRPLDESRLEHVQLRKLLHMFQPRQILFMFASVLTERRILVSSSKLSSLTSCIASLATLVYPLKWELIYIPMLPSKMIMAVCSPMPFLIGVLNEHVPLVDQCAYEDCMLHIDLDTNTFLRCYGDEQTLLPKKSMTMLTEELEALIGTDDEDIVEDNRKISAVFLNFMYKLLGHYKNHLVGGGGSQEIEGESFVEKSRGYLQPLMKKVSETQMFSMFTYDVATAGGYDQFKQFVDEKTHGRQSVISNIFHKK